MDGTLFVYKALAGRYYFDNSGHYFSITISPSMGGDEQSEIKKIIDAIHQTLSMVDVSRIIFLNKFMEGNIPSMLFDNRAIEFMEKTFENHHEFLTYCHAKASRATGNPD